MFGRGRALAEECESGRGLLRRGQVGSDGNHAGCHRLRQQILQQCQDHRRHRYRRRRHAAMQGRSGVAADAVMYAFRLVVVVGEQYLPGKYQRAQQHQHLIQAAAM